MFRFLLANMLRSTFFLSVFLFSMAEGISQNNNSYCFFDSLQKSRNNVLAEKIIQQAILDKRGQLNNESVHDTIRVIPVVVHIIHNGGSENISEAQVQSQIKILNEDFGRISGSNGFGNGVDTRVRFCLAKKNPDGYCTNGIVRIKSLLANHRTFQRAMLKELSFWDNTRYLNIYLVKSINGGVGGYSSFPGGPPDEDGVVVRHNLFGNIGTASSKLGRTTTHELGHYFGLYHTFNNGCGTDTCTGGDFICDTPPVDLPNFSCAKKNSCSNEVPDLDDQVENYMDYTPDACKNMLTNGQKERIQATLRNIRTIISTQSNLISTGCDSNYVAPASCPIYADFVTLNNEICQGNDVDFMDRSLNSATSWSWEFSGGNPSSSNLQNPTVTYNSIGVYEVKLVVSNANSIDSVQRSNYITVSAPGIGDPLAYGENFDSGKYPPAYLSINNLDGGITWELDSMASTSGKYSIKIDNYINTNYGSSDELVLPYLDFSSANPDSIIRMTFKWAYAKSDPTFSDDLLVLISTDCGSNFSTVFYRTQNDLATGPTQTTPFVPDSTQWKDAFVYLENRRDESYVLLKIVNVTDGGNNLYIDDIYVGDGSNPINSVKGYKSNLKNSYLFPNPVRTETNLEYSILKESYIRVSLYGIHGQHIRDIYEGVNPKGTYSLPIRVNSLSSGLYYVTIRTNEEEKALKLLVIE